MKKILFAITIIILPIVFILYHQNDSNEKYKIEKNIIEEKESKAEKRSKSNSNTEPIVTKATIGAIGDILIHNEVYEDAEETNGSYNFHKMFNEIRSTMENPDILIANQETMIGGKKLGLSTYPAFNSPYEVGDALKSAGVDIVTLANNHSLDRGETIIQSAISHWNAINMPYTGVFTSQADHDRIRTLTKNDIHFSFLAYTFGTNGIPIPKGKDYLVNLIDLKKIKHDVEIAKSKSDVVIVSMHWGNEYERLPNQEQIKLAKKLADMGVNIVIGNHPHVLQPPAWVTGTNRHKTLVFYSLGNFLSAQDELYELIGGIGTVEVIKTKLKNKETIELQNPSFTPTYNYYRQNRNFKIIPLLSMKDSDLKYSARRYKEIKYHMRKYIEDLKIEAPISR